MYINQSSADMVSYQYIAGFFDGEGYISIAKRSPNGHGNRSLNKQLSYANMNGYQVLSS